LPTFTKLVIVRQCDGKKIKFEFADDVPRDNAFIEQYIRDAFTKQGHAVQTVLFREK